MGIYFSHPASFCGHVYYYYTEWLEADELPVHLDGLSLDAVYENFVRQIAGTALDSDESATLKESVE